MSRRVWRVDAARGSVFGNVRKNTGNERHLVGLWVERWWKQTSNNFENYIAMKRGGRKYRRDLLREKWGTWLVVMMENV